MRSLKTLGLSLVACLGLALGGLGISSMVSACATTPSVGAAFVPQVPTGTPISLTFSPGVQTDGGSLTSQSFQTGAEPISAVVAISPPSGGATLIGTVCLLVSDDGSNFLDAGYCASYSQDKGTTAISVGAASGVPTPYGFAEVVVNPKAASAGNDGGVITGAAATLGR